MKQERYMTRYVTACVLSMFAIGAWAQSPQSPPHDHGTAMTDQSNLISGKTNPDQIPDELALRLLFELNLTGNTSALRAPQEQRMLRLMGFSESLLPQGAVILENYATKVRTLIARHNANSEVAAHNSTSATDTAEFWGNWKTLVDDTEASLKAILPVPSLIDRYIQDRKAGMGVSPTDHFIPMAVSKRRQMQEDADPGGMTPNYSTVYTQEMEGFGNGNPEIIISFGVTGDSSLFPPPTVPPGVTHTPSVTVSIPSLNLGGMVTGASGSPTSYISASNSITTYAQTIHNGGNSVSLTILGTIRCSEAGLFFGAGPPFHPSLSGFNLSLALTATADLGDPPTASPFANCPHAQTYQIAQCCSEQSQPPDMPVSRINVCDGTRWSYYMSAGVCLYNNTTVIFCSTAFADITGVAMLGGLSIPAPSAVAVGFNCTNHAKGIYAPWPWNLYPF